MDIFMDIFINLKLKKKPNKKIIISILFIFNSVILSSVFRGYYISKLNLKDE
tara:strand:- start:526 stop:681 length:156 start_codon:yes stop_codon:yes gene_type:complete